MSRLRDVETTAQIKLALIANPHISGFDISVDTVNRIVFLTGAVQDPDQRALAEDIARSHGGLDIKNDIQVLSEPAEEAGLIRRVAEKPSALAPEDVSIRERVLGNLEVDGRVNALMINVEEAGGIVRLSGVQESAIARRRAEEIARRVAGVTDVVNEIEVPDSPRKRADHAA